MFWEHLFLERSGARVADMRMFSKFGVCFKSLGVSGWLVSYSGADGQRAGMNAENVQKAASKTKNMTLEEAYKILGLERGAPIVEVEQVCLRLIAIRSFCLGHCAL
jgi:hypothetical protein